MTTRWETYPIKFEGGLITNVNRLEQGATFPGSATTLQNYEPDIREGYTKILGTSKFSETAVPGTGNVLGVVTVGPSEALALRSGRFYTSTGAGWTERLVQTAPTTGRLAYDRYNFTGVPKIVVVDGVNPPAYFDTVTKTMAYATAAPTDVVGASRAALYKSHLFFAKGPLLSFTVPFTEQNFSIGSGAGVINVGDEITGLIVFREQLIIFCLNKIFRLVGNSEADFQLQPITNDTGCLCGFTIQEVGGDIMYLGPDGIRYLSASERENDFGLSRASAKIQKLVTDATLSECFYSSVTIASKGQYRLFTYVSNIPKSQSQGFLGVKFSNQTVDDISWATLKGMKVYSLSKFQGRNRETLLFSSEDGFVYRMESGNSFDGEDIEAIFETPFIPVNDPKIRKTFYKHTAYVRPSGVFELGASLIFDYGQSDRPLSPSFTLESSTGAIWGNPSTVWGSFIWSGSTEKEFFHNVVGSGFTVALRYYDKSQKPSHNLNFAILEYRTNERR